jgi:galactonate dehydratase
MPKETLISAIDAFPLRPQSDGRQSVVLQIKTESGPEGWGEVPARPDVRSALASIRDAESILVGQDATAIVAIEAKMNDAGRRRNSPIPAAVYGGINMALHDVMGKLTKAPTNEVLGGPTRNKVRVMTPLQGSNDAQLIASLERSMAAGYRTVSVPLLMPIGKSSGQPFYDRVRQLLERMREVGGGEIDFALDCHGLLTPAEATSLGKTLEPFHLLWLDEPCHRVQQAALAGVAAETSTPLGLGLEVESNSEFQDLLRHDAVDVLRPDVQRWGISALRKVAALAETYYVALAVRNTGGPIATAAALQLAAAIPNVFAVEVPLPASDEELAMRRGLAGSEFESVKDGFVKLPVEPGLGLQLNRDRLQQFRSAT